MQEVDNAVNQAKKEIGTRYDFRGSKAEISLEGDTIKIIGDDEYKLNAIIDVLKGKMVKRNVAIKNLDYGKVEPAAGATVRQIITIKKGITKENAKEVVKAIKNMKSRYKHLSKRIKCAYLVRIKMICKRNPNVKTIGYPCRIVNSLTSVPNNICR